MLAINVDGTYFITIDNVKTNDVCTLLARIYYTVLSSFNAIKNYCLVERDSMIRLLSYNRLCFVRDGREKKYLNIGVGNKLVLRYVPKRTSKLPNKL